MSAVYPPLVGNLTLVDLLLSKDGEGRQQGEGQRTGGE